jgi:hypothetical protein
MSDRLSAAIEELEEHLARQLAEAADTKKTINSLRKAMGLEPLYTDTGVEATGSVRQDQFYGKGVATAAAEYLERRKGRGACTAEEIMKGLIEGGFDFDALGWKEKDQHRLLAVSLAKNTAKFHRLPNGTFGLLEWYPEAKKAAKERKQNGSVEAGNAETETEPQPEGEKASA